MAYTISDLVPQVVSKLRGRGDLSSYGGSLGSDIPSWLHDSITDLTGNFPFEELVVTGPFKSLIVGQSTYPLSFFLAENSPVFSTVRTFYRYFTTNNPPNLGDVGSVLKGRVSSVVYGQSNIQGLPQWWTQNGMGILFGFNPDQAYTVQMVYQRKHPFTLKNLLVDTVYMPNDWKEVLAYAAAIRGCEYLGMNDVAIDYYKKLHGDPKKPGNIGLLTEKISQLQRNITQNERQLQPIVGEYC